MESGEAAELAMLVIVIVIAVTILLAIGLLAFSNAATIQAQANLAQQQGAGGQIGDALTGLGSALKNL